MRRWLLLLVLCLGLLAMPHVAYLLDESCASTATQCSKEIAATATNSAVTFGFYTTEVCVFNQSTSTNTVYVTWGPDDAVADADTSHPIAVGDQICLGDQRSVNEVNVICAAVETATVQVLALKVR